MTFRDLTFFLRRLTANRNLLRNLVLRDLKHRYVGSVGGFVWSIVHPIVLLISYYFVFTVIFGMRFDPEQIGTDNFAIYVFSGFLPWLMFSDTVMRSCTSMTDNANLITKTVLPSEILPIAITIANLVHHLIGLVILLGVLAMFETVTLNVVWVVIYLPVLIVFAQGLGWLVSSLNVFFRDTSQVLNVLMIFWFWFTPILYSPELVPERFRLIVALNPMATVVVGYRSAFLNLSPPVAEHMIILAAWTTATFLLGALFFRRSKTAFADVL